MQFPDLCFCVLMCFFGVFFGRVGEEVKYMWYRFLYISACSLSDFLNVCGCPILHNFCSIDFFNFCNLDCEINLSC